MIEKSIYDELDNIAEVLLNTYFNYIRDPYLKEDLRQEAFLKALELLKKGDYNPDKSLRNYLFTGMRNAMSNYLYNNNKNTGYELDDSRYVVASTDCFYKIDTSEVERICLRYKIFGDYKGLVVKYFSSIGIDIPIKVELLDDYSEIILKAIIGEIIWNL